MTTTTLTTGYVSFASAINLTGSNVSVVYAAASSTPTLTNAGTIAATGSSGTAISFAGSGTVTNSGTVSMSGGHNAIVIAANGASIANTGLISGQVLLSGSGAVSNGSTGRIVSSVSNGLYLLGRSSVTNAGSITSSNQNGVRLLNGGSVSNQSTGMIAGHGGGVVISGSGTVSNAGGIAGTTQNGVFLLNGGTVSNLGGTASIFGGAAGVYVKGGAGTVINQGGITGTGTTSDGIQLVAGGSVTNANAATISGGKYAIYVGSAAAGTVSNAGLIQATGAGGKIGVVFGNGGTLTNLSTGTITGPQGGVFDGETFATITNLGHITGLSDVGVSLVEGTVDNQAGTAVISGGDDGIFSSGNVSVTNAGTMSGGFNGVFIGGGFVTNQGVIQGTTASGVYLKYGGGVSNTASATISGGVDGVRMTTDSGSVTNQGVIQGTTSRGIYLQAGGSVTNAASASITGGLDGILVTSTAGTVDNAGTIAGTAASHGTGIFMPGGSINNQGAGVIAGFLNGVSLSAYGSVSNQGSIGGQYGAGIYLHAGGTVTNSASATIFGNLGGVEAVGGIGMTLSNSGTIRSNVDGVSGTGEATNTSGGYIFGAQYGVALLGGGNFTNAGTVTGQRGVALPGSSTLITSGTIIGTGGPAVNFLDVSSRLVIDPGAVFSGAVQGNNGTIELAATGTAGVLSDIGNEFVVFNQVVVDPGASWTINTIAAAVGITAGDGALTVSGNVAAGTGFSLNSSGAGETLTLSGVTGTSFSNAIGNFSHHDEIVLPGVTFAAGDTPSFDGSHTLNILAGGTTVFTFSNFTLPAGGTSADLVVGAHSVQSVACFRAGTEIATSGGPMAVELLAAGDRVRTRDGLRPVRWVGQRRVNCRAHPRPADVMPVRVRAHAFGTDAPYRDLFLSPDHCVYVAPGVLVPVRQLVNGDSVAQIDVAEAHYFHVELDAHDVLFADGLECESYLDTGNRNAFANHDGAVALHPMLAVGVRDSAACAPLLVAGAAVEAARRLLMEQSTSF